jgi:hypothetical protein
MMSLMEVHDLRAGDEVYWNDPDYGACSKHIVIQEIEILGDTVCITDIYGDYLECFPHELS